MNKKFSFLLLSILILSLVLIVLSTSLRFLSGGHVPNDYGIAIDAGSSKTKFFLYDWISAKTNETGFVNELSSIRIKTNLDEHANDLPGLIKPIMNALLQISSKIDYTRKQYEIPIYLGMLLNLN